MGFELPEKNGGVKRNGLQTSGGDTNVKIGVIGTSS